MNMDEARAFVAGLDRESAWLLFDALEARHDIKVVAFTRQDIEYAIGFDGWKMTDEEWQKFSTSYYWRKGIDEQVNYAEIWDWARDAWEELGFELPDPNDEVLS